MGNVAKKNDMRAPASDALALHRTGQARIRRAMARVQVALSEADVDGNPTPALRAAARALRGAHEVFECLRRELEGHAVEERVDIQCVNAFGGDA
jgi:hypothetical protein